MTTESKNREAGNTTPTLNPLLQKIADLLSDAILIIDKKKRILFTNSAALILTSKSFAEIRGEELEELFWLEHIDVASKVRRLQLPKTGTISVRTQIDDITYKVFILRIDQIPYLRDLCSDDACALVLIRPESRDDEQDFDASVATYTQILGFLTLRITHDFNNSLTSILGNAQLVEEAIVAIANGQDPDPAATAAGSLQIIKDVVRKSLEMGEFVNTLQQYARQQPATREALDLNSAIKETLTIARRILGQKIKVEFLPGEGIPKILIDRALADQIIFGLLVNSKESMPRGGRITIETELALLDLEFADTHPGSRPGEYIRLSTSDNGSGMDKETLSKIFDPSFSGKIADKTAGLSLPTVYAIVKQNAGYIEVESWPGKGTHFHVYLPTAGFTPSPQVSQESAGTRQENGEAHKKPATLTPGPERPGAGFPPLILIAEDEADVRQYIERDVTKAGYRAIVTDRGDIALEEYKSLTDRGQRPALVIADLGLPGIDGRNLLKRIREFDKDAAVLLTSGYRIDTDEGTGKTEEHYDFIQKPFESASLIRRIERILNPAEAPDEDPR